MGFSEDLEKPMTSSGKSFKTMKLDYDGDIAVVTLCRPEARNAMNRQFFEDFQSILKSLSKDDNRARALLLLAEGKGFCAGADLKDQTGEMPPNLGDMLRQNYHPLITELKNLPMPTIVAINGAVAGAGMSLACAFDIAIAARDAYFLQAFINIALVPDAGSTYFLPRMVGRARAAAMMMTGEPLPAERALEFGIISEITEPDDLIPRARNIAGKLAAMPTQALFSIRKLLDSSENNTLAKQLEAEAIAQQAAGHSRDFMEGITAFLQKRPPEFKGK